MDRKTQAKNKKHKKIGEFLGRVPDGKIQNAEALDGFFAALVCCQDMIGPDEFIPILLNIGPKDDITHFANKKEAKQFFKLLDDYWNNVNHQICEKEFYLPLVLSDEDGKFQAEDWAHGFFEGTELRYGIWSDLLKDNETRKFLLPIWALAHGNHENPKLRLFKEPFTEQKRGELYIAAGYYVMEMYHHFSKQRNRPPKTSKAIIRSDQKIGRNAPCSCGSGKKFKQCCGRRPILN